MDLTIITIGGSLAVFLLTILSSIVKAIKKKNTKNVYIPVSEPVDQKPAVDTFIPKNKNQDKLNYEKFMATYSDGTMNFDIKYRPNAINTCQFGLSEGYRYYVKGTNNLWNDSFDIRKREMRWGYVRPHMGVDVARADDYTLKTNGVTVRDVIHCPFDFNRTSIIDYGDYSFGTLISLYSDEYEFEFRVAHMNPKTDILPWSYDRIKQGGSFKKGWVLGSAGTYGFSSGAHTHTEIKSYDDSCEVLDILLDEKYGARARKEYMPTQIVREYKKYSNFEKASNKEILQDWESWKRKKKILFANPYKIVRIDPIDNKTVRTWYSSYMLFGI